MSNGSALPRSRESSAGRAWGHYGYGVFYCACHVPLTLIFYDLFKGVNRSLALLVVFFSLVGTAVESVSLLCHFAPLILLGGGHYMGAFTTEQLQAWAYLSLRLF